MGYARQGEEWEGVVGRGPLNRGRHSTRTSQGRSEQEGEAGVPVAACNEQHTPQIFSNFKFLALTPERSCT